MIESQSDRLKSIGKIGPIRWSKNVMIAVQMKMILNKTLPILLLSLLLAACQGLGGEPRIIATIPPSGGSGAAGDQSIAETMLLGGEMWTANCAECHGNLGQGTDKGAPLPDLTSYSDEQILASVTNGITDRMPAFGETLAADQLQAVATYAKMISLARSRDMINSDNAAQNPDTVGVPSATEEAAPDIQTTNDPSVIQIERVTSQVEVLDDTLYILQIVQFINTSDSVYFVESNGGHNSVSVRVPVGAQMQNIGDNAYQLSGDGTQVFDIQPVLPGEPHIMHLAYNLPYDQTAADGILIEQTFDYPLVGSVDVLVATNGLGLTSETLTALDTRTSGGVTITRYGTELTLPVGAGVSYTISGIPVQPAPVTTASTTTNQAADPQNPIAYILIGAGGSALIIAGGLFLRERFFNPAKRPALVGAEDLMEQIAALDIQHKEGKITTEEYHRQRAILKTRLSTLMKSSKQ